MTDAAPPSDAKTAAPADAAPQGPQGPGFRIVAQYVKDLSFENPKAPDSLRVDGKPAIDMGVEMNAGGRPDGTEGAARQEMEFCGDETRGGPILCGSGDQPEREGEMVARYRALHRRTRSLTHRIKKGSPNHETLQEIKL